MKIPTVFLVFTPLQWRLIPYFERCGDRYHASWRFEWLFVEVRFSLARKVEL